jgi:hypothetical protein
MFNEQKAELKRKLAEKVRHQLRVMPNIEFFRDETLDYAYHIEDVFKKIKEEDQRIADAAQKPEPIKKDPAVKKKAVKSTAAKSKTPKSK